MSIEGCYGPYGFISRFSVTAFTSRVAPCLQSYASWWLVGTLLPLEKRTHGLSGEHPLDWTLLFNIGQSEAAGKRYGLAYEAFEEYLSRGGNELSAERVELVRAEISRLRELIGAVKILAPSGAIVTIDGLERGSAPLAGSLKIAVAVVHTIEVHHDGVRILSKNIRVSQT